MRENGLDDAEVRGPDQHHQQKDDVHGAETTD